MDNSITMDNLTKEQKVLAIQRLTALWAFAESGLGGMLHALQLPFTGLIVGGLSVIIITLIAKFLLCYNFDVCFQLLKFCHLMLPLTFYYLI